MSINSSTNKFVFFRVDRTEFHSCILRLLVHSIASWNVEWTLEMSSAEREHAAVVDNMVNGLLAGHIPFLYVFDTPFVHMLTASSAYIVQTKQIHNA